jgi:hypothetical protein
MGLFQRFSMHVKQSPQSSIDWLEIGNIAEIIVELLLAMLFFCTLVHNLRQNKYKFVTQLSTMLMLAFLLGAFVIPLTIYLNESGWTGLLMYMEVTI